MQIELTILIPVYNEVNLLEKFVNNLVNTFDNITAKYVFIDDGSTDGSNEWLSKNIPIICKSYKYDLDADVLYKPKFNLNIKKPVHTG